MNDDQLRALIRESVARHLGASGITPVPPPPSVPHVVASPASSVSGPDLDRPGQDLASAPGGLAVVAAPGASVAIHVSHVTFALPTAIDGSHDGPCQTEPHAGCTNCGFCQSLGY